MHKASVIAGLALVVLAVAYWVGADSISRSVLSGNVGADGLPKLLAVTLGVLSLILIVQERAKLRRPARAAADGPDSREGRERAGFATHAAAGGILLIGAGYVLILPYAGYVASVALLLFAVAWYHGKRSFLGVFAFSAIAAAAFYLIFVVLLDVSMPAGLGPALPGLS
jgi:hypothetical protein